MKTGPLSGPASRISEHLRLEIAAASRGASLGSGSPVPGCACVRCLVLAAGGDEQDVHDTEVTVITLSRLPIGERVDAARRWVEERNSCGRPRAIRSPGVLTILSTRAPRSAYQVSDGQVGPGKSPVMTRSDWGRRVATARGMPILEVVRRHVGQPVERGRSWLVSCPFHDDAKPSLSVNADRGVWYCFPCGFGGDALELVMRVYGLGFVDAVRKLTPP